MNLENILRKSIITLAVAIIPITISVAIVGSIFERRTAFDIFKLIMKREY